MYDVWLAVHVVCAVLWVGGGVSVHVLGRWVQKSGDPARMVAFNSDALKISSRFYAPLALVLIVAGVLLVEEVGYSYGDLWITLGLAAWLFSFVLAVAFYPREERRIEKSVAAEGPSATVATAGIRRVLMVNSIEITVLLLVVVNMAIKPGA
jgi:uncharacterized membrane protein